jgi:primosomal protein N' (replication factor Y)
VAAVRPLKLKQEKVRVNNSPAKVKPIAQVLVDHQILHLDQMLEYLIPEVLSEQIQIGALVEVELSHQLKLGVVRSRSEEAKTAGELREISKVLSKEPYLTSEALENVEKLSEIYGTAPWDFIRSGIPPFSKTGEKLILSGAVAESRTNGFTVSLPESLSEVLLNPTKFSCAIELPCAKPYWELLVGIIERRLTNSSVLLLVPSEREMAVAEKSLADAGIPSILVKASDGKAARYAAYLQGRSEINQVIIGNRSSSLMPLPLQSTIIVLDDVDESHYERKSPTWNTRVVTALREEQHSVLYISSTLSLEIAARITDGSLPLFRFPPTPRLRIQGSSASGEQDYFAIISKALRHGSVLISMGNPGYVTSFSCQKCRNIALCACGGKLFFPGSGKAPECATCSTKFIGWSCNWCGESKPRVIASGVLRRAEEFGKAFPGQSIISTTANNPITFLPDGKHLVLSTPGVEPRGRYSAVIFLDIEGRLLRTTLRATEEVRLLIMRCMTMLQEDAIAYVDLLPSDSFFQSLLRGNLLLAAQREIEERAAVELPPDFSSIVLTSENLESISRVLDGNREVKAVGPFIRNKRKSLLLKIPKSLRADVVRTLMQVNRVHSLRKEPLLTYQIDPYSLN